MDNSLDCNLLLLYDGLLQRLKPLMIDDTGSQNKEGRRYSKRIAKKPKGQLFQQFYAYKIASGPDSLGLHHLLALKISCK